MDEINKNKIVRIRNKKLDTIISTVAKFQNTTYQLAFEVWCDMMTSGYTTGQDTTMILSEFVARRLGKRS